MHWITIDKPPLESEKDALVLTDGGLMFVAYWDDSEGAFGLNNDYFNGDEVTHWMELPDLPDGFGGER